MINRLYYSITFLILLHSSCLKEETEIISNSTSQSFIFEEGGCKVITGEINENYTISANECYKLRGNTHISAGVTLTIESGATITAIPYSKPTYLSVRQGGQIIANGTADQPIIFTHEDMQPESWSGLHINGNAPTNKNGGSSQGLENTGYYGGNNPQDNSGVLNYVIIKYCGEELENGFNSNGLNLNAVGSETDVDFVQIYNCKNDGLKINGGNVDVNHLVVTHIDQDCVDIEYGWQGSGNNWYIKQIDEVGSDEAIQIDNDETSPEVTPVTNINLNNVTIIGFGEESAIRFRSNSKGLLNNILINNFALGIEITGTYCNLSVVNDEILFTNLSINNCAVSHQHTPSIADPSLVGIEDKVSSWFTNPGTGCGEEYGNGWMSNWTLSF